jgi:hypothetical protein
VKSLPATENFWRYDDITLKLYFTIADSGDIMLLQKAGMPNKAKCLEEWEEIIKLNAEVNNSRDYTNHLDNYKTFARLNRDYLYVKTMLLRMSISYSEDLRKELFLMGYAIDKENFEQSMHAADRKAENLTTKIKMKSNELNKVATKQVKKHSSDKALSQLSVSLGLVLPNDITLSLFNEYRQRAKEKQKALEMSQFRKRGM